MFIGLKSFLCARTIQMNNYIPQNMRFLMSFNIQYIFLPNNIFKAAFRLS